MARFEIWSSDLFDRESPASSEGKYQRLDEALRALWTLVLEQGVQDDGQPTFTDFQLRITGEPTVFIPRDPLHNPELALLRSRRHQLDLFDTLARIHATLLTQPFHFAPFLDAGAQPQLTS